MVQHLAMIANSAAIPGLQTWTSRNTVELAEAKLARSPYLALRTLRCDDHEGVLALRGHVPTYYLKQMAQTVVRDVPGVQEINNQVQVAPSAEQPRPLGRTPAIGCLSFCNPRS